MYRRLRVGLKVLHFSTQLESNILGSFSWDPDLFHIHFFVSDLDPDSALPPRVGFDQSKPYSPQFLF